jgi:hypothetical protein
MSARRGERGSRRRRKRCCRFCRELFTPDPRVGPRQVACSKPECQKARKKANQDDWVSRHPEYFRGRYPNTKRWLEDHPGYLAGYRESQPERVARDNEERKRRREADARTRADIQDSISIEPVVRKTLTPYLAETSSADIQDSILPQVIAITLVISAYLERRYTRLDRASSPPELPCVQWDGGCSAVPIGSRPG